MAKLIPPYKIGHLRLYKVHDIEHEALTDYIDEMLVVCLARMGIWGAVWVLYIKIENKCNKRECPTTLE